MEITPVIHSYSPQVPVPQHTNNKYIILIFGGVVILAMFIIGGLFLNKYISASNKITPEKNNNSKILPTNTPKPAEAETIDIRPTSRPYLSPTPQPTLIPTITPTINPMFPTQKTGSCGHGQCCLYSMCGDTLASSEGGAGQYCTVHQKCMFNKESGNWGCVSDCSCPYGCD